MKIPGFIYYLGFRLLIPIVIGGGALIWGLLFTEIPKQDENEIFDNYVQITCDVYARDKSKTEKEVVYQTLLELQKKMNLSDLELNRFMNTLNDLDDPNNRIYEALAKWVDCGFQKMDDYGIIPDKNGKSILDPNFKYE